MRCSVGLRPQRTLGAGRSGNPYVLTAPRTSHIVRSHKRTFKSFDDLLESSTLPVLVDFNAAWCGPCQMLSKSLGPIADQLKGHLTVVKIDTDKYPNIASKHRVQALPTLVLFKNGQAVDRIEGLLPEQQLLDRLKYHLQMHH